MTSYAAWHWKNRSHKQVPTMLMMIFIFVTECTVVTVRVHTGGVELRRPFKHYKFNVNYKFHLVSNFKLQIKVIMLL